MVALAIVAFLFWGVPCIILLLEGAGVVDLRSDAGKLFEREADRQMKRIDLNDQRIAQGLQPIVEPRYLHPDSEDAKYLKRLGLWPEAPDGYGGIWFNSPWARCRTPKPGQMHPGVISMKHLYWRFDPKKK